MNPPDARIRPAGMQAPDHPIGRIEGRGSGETGKRGDAQAAAPIWIHPPRSVPYPL
jgi:hypothetical protein